MQQVIVIILFTAVNLILVCLGQDRPMLNVERPSKWLNFFLASCLAVYPHGTDCIATVPPETRMLRCHLATIRGSYMPRESGASLTSDTHCHFTHPVNMRSTKDLSPETVGQIMALKQSGRTTQEINIRKRQCVCSQSVRCQVAKFHRDNGVSTTT